MHDAGVRTGILTNASERMLSEAAAALTGLPFDHQLSVDKARRFKPHPSVYQLAVDATGLPAERIGFVTANGWDAAGAGAFGFRVAWLRPEPLQRSRRSAHLSRWSQRGPKSRPCSEHAADVVGSRVRSRRDTPG